MPRLGLLLTVTIPFVLAVGLSLAAPTPRPSPSPVASPTSAAFPPPLPCRGCYIPPPVTPWQWQLTVPVNQTVNVPLYDIDLFDNDASVVAALHAAGRKVVCYMTAGVWERYRPDSHRYPDSVKGHATGWPGERWLDIRRRDVLLPIIDARLDLCKAKGFDSVEFDYMDNFSNDTGFPLTFRDQMAFNTRIVNAAHLRGLSAALKNDVEQAREMLPYVDWTLNEECFRYRECDLLRPLVHAGKAVMQVEYDLPTTQFCPQANAMNFNSMKKRLSLDAYRVPCR